MQERSDEEKQERRGDGYEIEGGNQYMADKLDTEGQ